MDISKPVAKTIEAVGFGIYSPDEIRRISVKAISNPDTLDLHGQPTSNGVYDPALGPYSRDSICATCKLDHGSCPGHFGHIDLPLPVYNPLLFMTMYALLRGTCISCFRLRLSPLVTLVFRAKLVLLHHGLAAAAVALDDHIDGMLALTETEKQHAPARKTTAKSKKTAKSFDAVCDGDAVDSMSSATRMRMARCVEYVRNAITKAQDSSTHSTTSSKSRSQKTADTFSSSAVAGFQKTSMDSSTRRALVADFMRRMVAVSRCSHCRAPRCILRQDAMSKIFVMPMGKTAARTLAASGGSLSESHIIAAHATHFPPRSAKKSQRRSKTSTNAVDSNGNDIHRRGRDNVDSDIQMLDAAGSASIFDHQGNKCKRPGFDNSNVDDNNGDDHDDIKDDDDNKGHDNSDMEYGDGQGGGPETNYEKISTTANLKSPHKAVVARKKAETYISPQVAGFILDLLWKFESHVLDLVFCSTHKPDLSTLTLYGGEGLTTAGGGYATSWRQNVPSLPSSPHCFFFTALPVAPTRFRPASKMGEMTFDHPQNVFLNKVLESAETVRESTAQISALQKDPARAAEYTAALGALSTAWLTMQFSTNSLLDSSIRNPTVSAANITPGIRQLLEKKEGLFRKHMMGKRVNYSARSVISPDPWIEPGEIGIPLVFALKLTYPEPVNGHNIKKLMKCVINGPEVWPGATHVQMEDGLVLSLKTLSREQRASLASQLLAPPQTRSKAAALATAASASAAAVATTGNNSSGTGTNGGVGAGEDVDETEKNSGFGSPATGTSSCFLEQETRSDTDTPQCNVNKKVFRHLENNDILLLNRQPTLHKPSIMAHRARVLPGEKTLRLHYANCNTYNADFDGDEMNVHFPQNEVARAEAYFIANTESQYLAPTDGSPLRGLIQDHVVTGVQICSRNTFIERDMYQSLLMAALPEKTKREGRILMLPPAIQKPTPLWTGKQVISSVLLNLCRGRPPLNLQSKGRVGGAYWGGGEAGAAESTVIVCEGELVTGVLDKSQIGASSYGLVHAVYEAYGGETAGHLLGTLGRLFTRYLQHFAFTCRMDDLLLSVTGDATRTQLLTARATQRAGHEVALDFTGAKTERELRAALEKTTRDSAKLDGLDAAMKTSNNKLTSAIISACIPGGLFRVFPENGMQLMTVTGAKGSNVNVSQISCCLGQQELEGRRVPVMVSGKTLPSFAPFETSARAGGFIAGRFLTGVKPQEYFFHCMAGREGLIDTAVKTSRSGYLQRCLMKHMEGLRVHYDGSVRNSDGSLLQFQYGEDCLDVTKQKHLQQFRFCAENYEAFRDRYKPAELNGRIDERAAAKAYKLIKRHEGSLHCGARRAGQPPPASLGDGATVMAVHSAYSHFGAVSERFERALDAYVVNNPDGLLITKAGRRRNNNSINSCDKGKGKGNDNDNDDGENDGDDDDDANENGADGGVVSGAGREENTKAITAATTTTTAKVSSTNVTIKAKAFRTLMQLKYMRSLVEPGESVGVLAAQSIGEPSTQMTLNTFHFAGFGAKNVTLGIPRLREIIMTASKAIKTPSMTLTMRAGLGDDTRQQFCKQLSRLTIAAITRDFVVTEQLYAGFADGIQKRVTKLRIKFYKEEDYRAVHHVDRELVRNVVQFRLVPLLELAIRKEYKRVAKSASGDDQDVEDVITVRQRNELQSLAVSSAAVSSADGEGSGPGASRRRRGDGAGDGAAGGSGLDDDEDGSSKTRGKRASVRRQHGDGDDNDNSCNGDDDEDEDGAGAGADVDATAGKYASRRKEQGSYSDGDNEEEDADDADNEVNGDGDDGPQQLTATATSENDNDDDEYFATEVDPHAILGTGRHETMQPQANSKLSAKGTAHSNSATSKTASATQTSAHEDSPYTRFAPPKSSSGFVTDFKFDSAKGSWAEIELTTPGSWRKLLMTQLVEAVIKASVVREVPKITRCFPVVHEGSDNAARAPAQVGTEGANLEGMWEYPEMIDVNSIRTNDIAAMLHSYGVEAARGAIISEIAGVFDVYGISVDKRHLTLVADYMTCEGAYRPFNRIGMSSNPSPLLKMSFETTCAFLKDAIVASDSDLLQSPSARLVVGSVVECGSNCFEVMQPLKLF